MRMKKIREKGKLKLSRYFQELNKGDGVSIVKELSLRSNFPERLRGKTGIVNGKVGNSIIVKLKDVNQEKRFLIEPIHLKKIKG